MPYLKIDSCVDCPHSQTSNHDTDHNYVGDDMFHIWCNHEEQENEVGFTAKIKNKYSSIYFNCPLEKKVEISCAWCSWEGKESELEHDYGYPSCPNCTAQI